MRSTWAPFLNFAPPKLPAPFDFGRVRGMMLGLAIGDALGNTTEGRTPEERERAAVGFAITCPTPITATAAGTRPTIAN